MNNSSFLIFRPMIWDPDFIKQAGQPHRIIAVGSNFSRQMCDREAFFSLCSCGARGALALPISHAHAGTRQGKQIIKFT